MIILAMVAAMVYRHKKRERDQEVLEPRVERPPWSKAELPGKGLLELKATETMPAELETMPAELESSGRSQELSNMREHSE